MDAAVDATRGDAEASTATAFVVAARRVEGADVGPVVLEDGDATVGDLKRALMDAPWSTRETPAGAREDGDGTSGEKPPTPAYLRVVLDGKVLTPDTKALTTCGLVRGAARIVHLVVSDKPSTPVGTGTRTSAKDARATAPTCCAVM
jgi:hypothetical protein